MNLQFNPIIANKLSIEEAIVIGWLEYNNQEKLIAWQSVKDIFSFWDEETLMLTFAQLQNKQLLKEKRDLQQNCIFSINKIKYKELTGQNIQQKLPSALPVILDKNLTKHLQRFKNNDSILNKKLSLLISNSHQEMINYATEEGLPLEIASSSFDKFLHYVSSHPDKFWNTDLTSYWGFWVSNNLDRQKKITKGQGKRSAVERSNLHVGSNWLKNKAQHPRATNKVVITHKD